VGIEERTEGISDDIWDAIWCPACGSRDFARHPFEGTFCDGCGANIGLDKALEDAALLMFSDVKEWGIVENNAQEIGGKAIARMVRRDGEWYLVDWLCPDDFTPHPPEQPSVEQVEELTMTEIGKSRMVN